MADTKISALTELTSVDSADLIAIVDDPAGTPVSKKITKANLVKNIAVSDLADGTDGELITWSSTGQPTTVAVGTSGHVLTSAGSGAAPSFQALPTISIGSGGTGQTSQQDAIDALTKLSGATTGHFLTKGSSGNATFAAAAEASPLTTKGDVYVYGTGNARLAVGTNGQVLKADSTTATGLAWGAGGGGASETVDFKYQSSSYTTPSYTTRTVNDESTPIQLWIQDIDSNNQAVYVRIKKNGSYVNVQVG